MHKGFLKTAALLGVLSVGMGAFAAHALKELVSQRVLITFEIAVRYQFYHLLALALIAILYKEFPNKRMLAAGWLFIVGIIIFCGSLYLLCFVQAAVQPGYNWLGAITPIGGMAFIAGWAMLFAAILSKKN
jgi:uncharacterized membrane protein YgdD (TMEM256/DUF423 family)